MGKRENLREAGGRPKPSDPHLWNRMEEYGRKHGLNDIDAMLEYLRDKYPEYQRKQAVPFKKYMQKQVPDVLLRIEARKRKEEKEKEKEREEEVEAVRTVAPESRVEEEEDRLREREDAHIMDRNGVGDMNDDLAFDVDDEAATGSAGKSAMVVEEEKDKPAFAPPHMIAELLKAQAMRPAKSPSRVEPAARRDGGAVEERGSPPAQSSGRPPQPVKASSQFQGSVVQQDTPNGRPYLPLASFSRAEKSKQNEDRDRESAVVLQEGKAIRKRDREMEKAQKGNKKGKWVHEKGEREAPAEDRGASSATAVPRNVSFKDFGGIDGILAMIRELIEYPLVHPDLYDWLGVQPPRGVLLHGPPGCGKTMLANAIAVETGVPFLKISAPEVVSGMSGMLLAL